MKFLYYGLIGLIFGAGMVISGMVDPNKVLNFFDVFGQWDPSLAFVMAGGLAVNLVGNRLSQRRAKPVFSPAFAHNLPMKIDRRLVVGSALFGIGWGIAGFCPGPAVVALGTGNLYPIVFIAAVLIGMALVVVMDARGASVGKHKP